MTDVINFKEKIKMISSSWYEVKDGTISVGPGTESFIEHGILIHNLQFEDFTDIIVVLTNVMLLPNQGVYLRNEHYDMWNWGANLITVFCPEKQPPVEIDYEKRFMFEALVRCMQPYQHIIPRDQNQANIRRMLDRSNVIAANLSFPMLERVLKEKCAEIVDLNGKVLKDFTVTRFDGNKQEYSPTRKKTISSIEDLLSYYLENIVSNEIKTRLEEIFDQIFKNYEHPYKKIYHGAEIIQVLRNSALHGAENLSSIAGGILSIILLIEIDSLRNEFDFIKSNALLNYKFYGNSKDSRYYTLGHEEYYSYRQEWIK